MAYTVYASHSQNTPILPILLLYGASGARAKNQNSRNCSNMAHVGKTLVSFSRWRQQLERSIHFASLLHVWWERSSGTWHATLNVNRTTWSQGPFRWSFPPHKSVNNGQKHIAAHALRACFAPLTIPQVQTTPTPAPVMQTQRQDMCLVLHIFLDSCGRPCLY